MGKKIGVERREPAKRGYLWSCCESKPEKCHDKNDCAASVRGEIIARKITKKKGRAAVWEKSGAKHRELAKLST